jgi:outer membrane protein OmpA-like peptidoglycan-associated protein
MTALNMGRSTASLGAAVLLLFGTGCATKKHVRGVVAPVEARVSANEKKTTDNASAIGELENSVSRADEKAMDADRKAVAAGQEAARANEAARGANEAARTAHTRADSAHQLSEGTRARLGEVVENIDNYKLVTNQSVLFPLNKSTLTKDAQAQLDQAVGSITNNKNYILEIQGFTDQTGSQALNLALSQKRADSVVRYLTVNHNVPLRKIHVLGVGEENAAADNTTRDGRKQNRRVEIKVFALDLGATAAGTQASGQTTPVAR